MKGEPPHHAGNCWCNITHTVAGTRELNGEEPEYSAMIQRTTGQEDPLVQEPKK